MVSGRADPAVRAGFVAGGVVACRPSQWCRLPCRRCLHLAKDRVCATRAAPNASIGRFRRRLVEVLRRDRSTGQRSWCTAPSIVGGSATAPNRPVAFATERGGAMFGASPCRRGRRQRSRRSPRWRHQSRDLRSPSPRGSSPRPSTSRGRRGASTRITPSRAPMMVLVPRFGSWLPNRGLRTTRRRTTDRRSRRHRPGTERRHRAGCCVPGLGGGYTTDRAERPSSDSRGSLPSWEPRLD